MQKWLAHVFDHPVEDPEWHWALGAPVWDGEPELIASLIAETFERSGEVLARFSDAQLNQGFGYLLSASCSGLMVALVDPEVPLSVRLRALGSFIPLFEQILEIR